MGMQFTDEQNASAVLAALDHTAERNLPLSTDDVASLVQAILNGIPTAPGITSDNQIALADSLTKIMEIAVGQRASALQGGFDETQAGMMAASAYGALMMKIANG